jgi:uncharacterized membrane protein (UPF0127 family)
VTHVSRLRPWSFSFGRKAEINWGGVRRIERSANALELAAGTAESLGIAVGDRLEVNP